VRDLWKDLEDAARSGDTRRLDEPCSKILCAASPWAGVGPPFPDAHLAL
jgi:hypothetical protein